MDRGGGVFGSGCRVRRRLDAGDGVAKDEARAVELYTRACEGGEVVACSDLGLMAKEGRGRPKSASSAGDLFKKACEAGALAGCANLGIAYAAVEGVPANPAVAVELLERACRGKELSACHNLAVLYLEGARGATRGPVTRSPPSVRRRLGRFMPRRASPASR
jgi:TPR repeat protein